MRTHQIYTGRSRAAVYLLRRLDRRRFKIGWSVSPMQRIHRLPEFAAGQLDLKASVAVWLPLMPSGSRVEVAFVSGRRFTIQASCWPLLPTACRLEGIGADFEFLDDAKRVKVDGLMLYSPLWSRDEASYYKEVLLDDAYGVRQRDLRRKGRRNSGFGHGSRHRISWSWPRWTCCAAPAMRSGHRCLWR